MTLQKIIKVSEVLDSIYENPQLHQNPEFLTHFFERKLEKLESKLVLTLI